MDIPSVFRKFGVLTTLVIGYSVSLFYGLTFLYSFFRRWITDTSKHFWEVKSRELPPDCLNDPELGTHNYIQIKNVKLHYVEKGDRSKPLMLCIHGFPEFWYSWRYQLREFSDDYWVVAVDMRGYGDSEKPVGRDKYTINQLISDVKNLITALGREKCTLVAHDWGGIIAWYFVLLNPQMVDSYIIMNSVHPIAFLKVMRKSLSQFKKSWYIFFFQLPYLPELSCRMDDMINIEKTLLGHKKKTTINENDIEAFKFTFGKTGAFTCPINYYRANFMLMDRFNLESRGKQEDFPPGLVLYGEGDLYIDRTIQEVSASLVRNCSVVYIKDANHFVQQDDPVAVNKAMRAFFHKINNTNH